MPDPTAAKPNPTPTPPPEKPKDEIPTQVVLMSYPKIVFLYPVFLAALVAAIWLSCLHDPLTADSRTAVAINTIFLVVLGLNLVILAFDFPRTTSLTLFFCAVAVVMGLLLWFRVNPDILPHIHGLLAAFRPLANPAFYWTIVVVLGVIFLVMLVVVRFDYWEVRPNELLHHHGFLANLERMSAPNLRIDKEINDIFEYLLLRSGRLIIQASNERRAIVLDNVPLITKKETAITRMLGASRCRSGRMDPGGKTRNPKHQIPNRSEVTNPNVRNVSRRVWDFRLRYRDFFRI